MLVSTSFYVVIAIYTEYAELSSCFGCFCGVFRQRFGPALAPGRGIQGAWSQPKRHLSLVLAVWVRVKVGGNTEGTRTQHAGRPNLSASCPQCAPKMFRYFFEADKFLVQICGPFYMDLFIDTRYPHLSIISRMHAVWIQYTCSIYPVILHNILQQPFHPFFPTMSVSRPSCRQVRRYNSYSRSHSAPESAIPPLCYPVLQKESPILTAS